MAKTIPQLTDATTVNAADELIIQQGGITKRATATELATGLAPLVNSANGTFNVKDFGAVGDGAADDTAAIQAAISAGDAVFPSGTYRITSTIAVPSNRAIYLGSAVINMTGVIGAGSTFNALLTAFNVAGTIGSPVSLTNNSTETTAQLSSAAGYSAGSLVLLTASTKFDPDRVNANIGEIAVVRSVVGSTLTFVGPLEDSYTTAASSTTSLITPVENVRIFGGKIVADGAATNRSGIRVHAANNVQVSGTWFYNLTTTLGSVCLSFRDSIHCLADKCRFEMPAGNKNYIYGWQVADASRDCACVNGQFINLRHAMTTSTSSRGVVRRTSFVGNSVLDATISPEDTFSDAVDTHSTSQYVLIANNTIYNSTGAGINIECPDVVISNNVIKTTGTLSNNAILVRNWAARDGSYSITNNLIENSDLATGSGGSGIRVVAATEATTKSSRALLIEGNTITNAAAVGIYVEGNATNRLYNLIISNNTVANTDNNTGAVYVSYAHRVSLSNNAVSAKSASQPCIRVEDSKYAVVANNVLELASSSTAAAIRVFSTGIADTDNVVVTGNVVTSPSPSNSKGVQIDAGARAVSVTSNVFNECTTPISAAASVISSGTVTINGNTGLVLIDTEASGATDDLDAISGGIDGQILSIRAANDARTIVAKDGTNLKLNGDFSLDSDQDVLTLILRGGTWYEIARSNNAA